MPPTRRERTLGHVEFEKPVMCQGRKIWYADNGESGSLEEVSG